MPNEFDWILDALFDLSKTALKFEAVELCEDIISVAQAYDCREGQSQRYDEVLSKVFELAQSDPANSQAKCLPH
jgi:hypothetical protein